MTKINLSSIVLFALAICFIVSFAPKDADVVGKVSFPLGNVLILSRGEQQMRQVSFNMPVTNGDKIETKKQSRCEVTFNDGSIVRIDEQSIYTVEKAVMTKKEKNVESDLAIGKLWANVKKVVGNRDTWKLKSPAAVVAVRGTIYRMNSGADSSTQVLVYDGNVTVSPNLATQTQGMGVAPGKPTQVQGPSQVQGPHQVSIKEWFEIVKAQQQIIVRPDGSYVKSDFNLADDAKLEWVRWNQERDKLAEQQ
jgi:hypothetical protein